MESKHSIQERRRAIVEEMLRMESMRRGTLNEQFLQVPQKGAKEPALRGPYYVLSRHKHGKTISERIPAGEVQRVRQDIARYDRFMELCREFCELTERLGVCTDDETLKKTPKSPSRKTRK